MTRDLQCYLKDHLGNRSKSENRGQEMNVDSQDYWIYVGDLMQYFRKRIEDFQKFKHGLFGSR